MTLTLELPEELEHKLTTEAARCGLPVERYALRLLANEPETKNQPGSGAELVAYWRNEGVIGSRPDIRDSQAHARELRRKAGRR